MQIYYRNKRAYERTKPSSLVVLYFISSSVILIRVSALHVLLQTQDQYEACIANIQQELQEYWELLEDLHTKVTLQPEKGPEDPHAVLIDTEVGYLMNTF